MKKLTTKEFIKKARKIHGNKYDYSTTIYGKDNKEKIRIICLQHGLFFQRPVDHLQGKNCKKCSNVYKPTTKEFIKKAQKIHGSKYNYSLFKYIGTDTKSSIICKTHGIFKQSPSKHITRKQGCPKCGIEKNKKSNLSNTVEFKRKFYLIFGNKYDLKKFKYVNAHYKSVAICNKLNHGEWLISPNNLLRGYGCPKCNSSKGEIRIREWLIYKKIKFDYQKCFTECMGKGKQLPFDFYCKDYKTIIEFDGRQHFKKNSFFNGLLGFKSIKKNDGIKTKWAKKNGYRLLRIPYTKFDKIEEILNKEFEVRK